MEQKYLKQANCGQCIWENKCGDYEVCDNFSPIDDELDSCITVERERSEWQRVWNNVTREHGDGGSPDLYRLFRVMLKETDNEIIANLIEGAVVTEDTQEGLGGGKQY